MKIFARMFSVDASSVKVMSSPHPALRTANLPESKLWEVKPAARLQTALETRFTPLQTTHPGMVRFARSNKNSQFLRFDHRWHLSGFVDDASGVPQRSGPFKGYIQQFQDSEAVGEQVETNGFCKITHLLDAFRMIQGQYPMAQHPGLPAPGRKSAKVYSKLHDAHNQAYVDAVACYTLSKFREAGYSPHFSLFYGAYLAIAKEYYFNITEDYPDIRFESWFWRNRRQGIFRLLGFVDDEPMDEEDPLLEEPEDLMSDEDTLSTSSKISELHDADNVKGDCASLESASITTGSSLSSDHQDSSSEEEDDDSEDDEDDLDEMSNVKLFAAIKEFPTMLMFLEANKDTLDSLLDSDAPAKSENLQESEKKWSAWLFQVIAALCQVQSLWGMTHNDLHSNNILWTPTTEEYFHYKTNDGRLWKVPTYGKLFRIIDFGRAIYTHNDTLCISDDYFEGNEAGGQYNFGPFYNPEETRVYPNPSFDLCRLAVSLVESLWDTIPEPREGGCVLSEEPGRKQMETVSDLFNVMWQWMVDEDGHNVLWDENDEEKYPGFELYRVIAQKIKNAVPREQLDRAPFRSFALANGTTLPSGTTVYPLFC